MAPPDVVARLHAGDVAHGPACIREDEAIDPKRDPLRVNVYDWFAGNGPPVSVVRGNHDRIDSFWAFRDGRDIGGRVVKLADHLFLAGIGWSGDRYFETPDETDLAKTCETVIRQVRRLRNASDCLIILSHYPPTLDVDVYGAPRAEAWHVVRRLIDICQPILVVTGHVHTAAGRTVFVSSGTVGVPVVNPGRNGAIVSIDVAERRVREICYE